MLVADGLVIDSVVAIVLNYIEYGHRKVKTFAHDDLKSNDEFDLGEQQFQDMFELEDGRVVVQSKASEWYIYDLEHWSRAMHAMKFFIHKVAVMDRHVLVSWHSRLEYFDTWQNGFMSPLCMVHDVIGFAAGGEQLLVICKDGTMFHLDLTTFKVEKTRKVFPLSILGHLSFVVSPSGKHAAMITVKSDLIIIDIATFAIQSLEPSNASCALLFLSDTLLAAACKDATVRIWDFDTGEYSTLNNTFVAKRLLKLQCGTLCALGEEDANFWNLFTGRLLATRKFIGWKSAIVLRDNRLLIRTEKSFHLYE